MFNTIQFDQFNPSTETQLTGFAAFADGTEPFKAWFKLDGADAAYVFHCDEDGIDQVTLVSNGQDMVLELTDAQLAKYPTADYRAMFLETVLKDTATLADLKAQGFFNPLKVVTCC